MSWRSGGVGDEPGAPGRVTAMGLGVSHQADEVPAGSQLRWADDTVAAQADRLLVDR